MYKKGLIRWLILKVMPTIKPKQEIGNASVAVPLDELPNHHEPLRYAEAPEDLVNALIQRLGEAFAPETPPPTPTATATFMEEHKDRLGGKKSIKLFMVPYPKAPQKGFVFPGGGVEKGEEPLEAAMRELEEELEELIKDPNKQRAQDDGSVSYNGPGINERKLQGLEENYRLIRQRIRTILRQARRATRRFFALTLRETNRGDSALQDMFYASPLPGISLKPEEDIFGTRKAREEFAKRFLELPPIPIPTIPISNPSEVLGQCARCIVYSYTVEDSAIYLPKLISDVLEATSMLRPDFPHFSYLNTIEGVLLFIKTQTNSLRFSFQSYLNQFGNTLAIYEGPELRERLPTDPEQATALQALEESSTQLIRYLQDVNLLIQVVNLEYIMNQILTQMPLKYPADAAILAMLRLYWARGKPIPDQYIAYLPSEESRPFTEVILATELPDLNQPILIHISPEPPRYPPGFGLTPHEQRLWARVYLLNEQAYAEIKSAVGPAATKEQRNCPVYLRF